VPLSGKKYKTNPNVGEASVLHIIENAKQSQFPIFSAQKQRCKKNKPKISVICERYGFQFVQNKAIFTLVSSLWTLDCFYETNRAPSEAGAIQQG
jgi:hypothetical protein